MDTSSWPAWWPVLAVVVVVCAAVATLVDARGRLGPRRGRSTTPPRDDDGTGGPAPGHGRDNAAAEHRHRPGPKDRTGRADDGPGGEAAERPGDPDA